MFVPKGVRVAGPPLCFASLWLGVVLVLKEDSPRNQQGTTAQDGRLWPDAQRRLLTDEARQHNQQWKWCQADAAQVRCNADELANLIGERPNETIDPELTSEVFHDVNGFEDLIILPIPERVS